MSLDVWKQAQDAMRADAHFMQLCAKRNTVRSKAQKEIHDLFESFRAGGVSLAELRATFDSRTRTDWEDFGLKGYAGAMFLNTLVKYLPDAEAELKAHLAAVVAVPTSAEEGRERMTKFFAWLVGAMDRAGVKGTQIQSSRTPFLVGAVWHFANSDQWPIFYESMRSELEKRGLLQLVKDEPVENYFRFVRATADLREALGLSTWDLEHLCKWMAAPPATNASAASNAPVASPEPARRWWLFAPGRNASLWPKFQEDGIAAIGWDDLGDLTKYVSFDALKDALRAQRGPEAAEPIQDALACWEFSREMRPGDLIFAKRGRNAVIGCGVVRSAYRHESERAHYRHVHDVDWLWSGEVSRDKQLVLKTLTDITDYPAFVQELRDKVGVDALLSPKTGEPESEPLLEPAASPYTVDDASADLFRSRENVEHLLALALHRKNIVLQGPPGVGKTFVARRLADLIVGRRDPENVCFVQFHQSYAYDDFVQGYRPAKGGGFELRDGPFLRFCDRALQDRDDRYVLLIFSGAPTRIHPAAGS